MEMVTVMFLSLCEKDEEGNESEPNAYAVILPYGLQCPFRHPTIEDLCTHITAQLHQGETFDLEGLRAALSRREKYALSVDKDLAARLASQPL
jgi:hypothetical protein